MNWTKEQLTNPDYVSSYSREIFTLADSDGDGSLTESEAVFLVQKFFADRGQAAPEQINFDTVRSVFDANGDGNLSYEEVRGYVEFVFNNLASEL